MGIITQDTGLVNSGWISSVLGNGSDTGGKNVVADSVFCLSSSTSVANSAIETESVGQMRDTDGTVAGQFGRVLKEWERRKMNNLRLAELYEKALAYDAMAISEKRLEDLKACGTALKFRRYEGGQSRLMKANFCRWRLCPICQWRRSLKLYGQMVRLFEVLKEKGKKLRFLFLTLTVKNIGVDSLGTTITKLNDGFKRLMHSRKISAVTYGYVKALEVTIQKKDLTVHPHLHVLLMVAPEYFGVGYIKQVEWQEIWQSAMSLEYSPIIDIKAVKGDSYSAMVAEVTKAFNYSVKVGGDVERLIEVIDGDGEEEKVLRVLVGLTRELHKRRFISFGGGLMKLRRELKMTDADKLVDEDDEFKGLKLLDEVTAHYDFRSGVYVI